MLCKACGCNQHTDVVCPTVIQPRFEEMKKDLQCIFLSALRDGDAGLYHVVRSTMDKYPEFQPRGQ